MNLIASAFVAAVVGVLGACAQVQPPPVGGASTPRYDSTFGDAVRQARAAQTINPDAGRSADPAAGIDAQSARSATTRAGQTRLIRTVSLESPAYCRRSNYLFHQLKPHVLGAQLRYQDVHNKTQKSKMSNHN